MIARSTFVGHLAGNVHASSRRHHEPRPCQYRCRHLHRCGPHARHRDAETPLLALCFAVVLGHHPRRSGGHEGVHVWVDGFADWGIPHPFTVLTLGTCNGRWPGSSCGRSVTVSVVVSAEAVSHGKVSTSEGWCICWSLPTTSILLPQSRRTA